MIPDESTNSSYTLGNIEKTTYDLLETCPMNYTQHLVLYFHVPRV